MIFLAIAFANSYDFSPITDELEDHLEQFEGRISFLVQKKDGTILIKKHMSDSTQQPFTDDSFIHIASGCKWPAMATIMRLIEDGKLSFDSTIGDFYKNGEFTGEAVSVKLLNLMTHSSGFGYFDDWCATPDVTLQDSVLGIARGGIIDGKQVKASPLVNKPGTTVLYGDIAMQIAGAMAEKASGKGFNTLFREYIADPLGMVNANFTPCDGEVGINIAIADGLKIRLQDYANFMLMLMNGGTFNGKQILKPESAQAMLKDYTSNLKVDPTNLNNATNGKLSFALGTWMFEDGNIYSSNGIYGFYNYFDVKNEYLAIFYLRTQDENTDDVFDPLQDKITSIVLKACLLQITHLFILLSGILLL